jgi:hypothetical protein
VYSILLADGRIAIVGIDHCSKSGYRFFVSVAAIVVPIAIPDKTGMYINRLLEDGSAPNSSVPRDPKVTCD